jgi:diacylglycerol kinase family enzyme
MRIAAVVNPVAGSRKATKEWPVLLQAIGKEAKRVDTFWSEYPGHSESIAASVRRSGYDRVIAVGGDGTLFEVLNGLWWEERGHMPSLGVIPFGTGCDYIRNFETGTGMAAKLKTAVEEPAVRVSLGRCSYQAQDAIRQRVFAMVLGLGFDAEVIHRYKELGLPRSCWFSYAISALAGIRKLRPFTLDGVVEDSPFRLDAVFFGAALGCCFGDGMRIAPRASPSNNRFEFVLAAPVSPVGLLFPILRAYLRLNGDSPLLKRLRGRRAKIGSSTPVRFEADGELLGKTDVIDIELIPEAFSFAARKIKSPS